VQGDPGDPRVAVDRARDKEIPRRPQLVEVPEVLALEPATNVAQETSRLSGTADLRRAQLLRNFVIADQAVGSWSKNRWPPS
jgi:hypothetical protein